MVFMIVLLWESKEMMKTIPTLNSNFSCILAANWDLIFMIILLNRFFVWFVTNADLGVSIKFRQTQIKILQRRKLRSTNIVLVFHPYNKWLHFQKLLFEHFWITAMITLQIFVTLVHFALLISYRCNFHWNLFRIPCHMYRGRTLFVQCRLR